MFVEYNANPLNKRSGDCAVRAVSKALGVSWESAYVFLCTTGMELCDMPNNNGTIGLLLKRHGFHRNYPKEDSPDSYTVERFCEDYPHGTYVVFTGGHVLAVCNGNVYDSWNSLAETVIYFYEKGE